MNKKHKGFVTLAVAFVFAGVAVRRLADWITACWRAQEGVVVVEFALVAPMMMMIALVGLEMARGLQHYHVATKAVRDGARYLSRVADPTDATAQANTRNLVLTGSLDGSSNWLLYYSTDPSNVAINVTNVPNLGSSGAGSHSGRVGRGQRSL